MPSKAKIDEEELKDKYLEGYSLVDLGDYYSLNPVTIANRLESLGLRKKGSRRKLSVNWSDKESIREHIQKNVTVTKDDCWEWDLGMCSGGYGYLFIPKVSYMAHRISYMAFNEGVEVGKLHVCHKCDNPPCVNPDHLFLGTASDNMNDMFSKSRGVRKRGEEHYLTALNDDDVRAIVKEAILGKLTGEALKVSRELSNKYGVSVKTINCMSRGKTWEHITRPILTRAKEIITNEL